MAFVPYLTYLKVTRRYLTSTLPFSIGEFKVVLNAGCRRYCKGRPVIEPSPYLALLFVTCTLPSFTLPQGTCILGFVVVDVNGT